MAGFSIIIDQVSFVIVILYSIYFISIGNLDASTWPTVVDLSISLDTSSIFGWYIWTIEVQITDLSYILILTLATTYFVGCCIYLGALCDQFDLMIRSAQRTFQQKYMKNQRKIYKRNYNKVKRQFHEAIKMHIQIHE